MATSTTRSRAAEPSDEHLLLQYRRSGDRAGFETLVHRYQRELYNYLRRYLGDAEMAEDAFQQAFLQVHLKCDQFEEGRRFRPWLYTIATNQAIDAQRRAKRRRMVSLDRSPGEDESDAGALVDLLESTEAGPMALASAQERRTWIRRAMEDLPESMRLVVHMIYYQNLKYREAAEALDIPVGTVKSRLHAAIIKLNQAWRATHEDE